VRFQETFLGRWHSTRSRHAPILPRSSHSSAASPNQAALCHPECSPLRGHPAACRFAGRAGAGTYRDLEEARRQAEGASRFKSEFLANMSH